jgi:alpha-N-arabinofuranosidase
MTADKRIGRYGRQIAFFFLFFGMMSCVCAAEESSSTLVLKTDTVVNTIDEKVYGHFLEHIYHSTNGGLWGELVWNRSMEVLPAGAGAWSVKDDELVQGSLGTDVRLVFGERNWTDYELLLEAQKTGGDEGFLIVGRADGNRYYWANFGGWGNTRHQFEKSTAGGGRGAVGPSVNGSIAPGKWYTIRIRCKGNQIQAYLDGDLVLDYTDTSSAYAAVRRGGDLGDAGAVPEYSGGRSCRYEPHLLPRNSRTSAGCFGCVLEGLWQRAVCTGRPSV